MRAIHTSKYWYYGPEKQMKISAEALLSRSKTALVNIPPGIHSYIQVLDVSINKPYTDEVRWLLEKHFEENL